MFHTGEIVWAYIRGFPWWPGRVVTPTAAQLKRLSTERIPSDQRLVWFFNDNNRYTLIHVKNIRGFRDQQIILQTKSKTGKLAAQLKHAFEAAYAEYRRSNELDDEELVDAVVIAPSTAQRTRATSTNQSRKSKKRKTSDSVSSPSSEKLPPKESNSREKAQPMIHLSQPLPHPKPVRYPISHKKPQSSARTPGDAESDKLSTHCNPSPSDRSSQETGIDSRSNLATSKHTPPHSILLRLRIRQKRPAAHKEKQNDSPVPDAASSKHGGVGKRVRTRINGEQIRKEEQRSSLGIREHLNQSANRPNDDSSDNDDMHSRKDGTDRSRRKKRKVSDLPPKRRQGPLHDGDDATKRRRLTSSKRSVESPKPGLSEGLVLGSAMDIVDVSVEDKDVKDAQERKPMSEPHPSTKVTGVVEPERVDRPDAPLRRSKRMRRMSTRIGGTEEDSNRESEDDAQQTMGSKRSRGVEAPRMSDGQRRLHSRQVGNMKRNEIAEGNGEKGRIVGAHVEHLEEDKISGSDVDDRTKVFEDLSKDECIKIIHKLRETIRRKSVQLWLRGRKLVEAREVLRTEEGLIKACESGIEKAENLLRWVKKYDNCEKGEGSRFAKLEMKAIEECEILVDVYFDRRRVSLKKIAPRILKLTKELAPHSSKLTEMLLELLVLWLDLMSGSAKKTSGIKSKQ